MNNDNKLITQKYNFITSLRAFTIQSDNLLSNTLNSEGLTAVQLNTTTVGVFETGVHFLRIVLYLIWGLLKNCYIGKYQMLRSDQPQYPDGLN